MSAVFLIAACRLMKWVGIFSNRDVLNHILPPPTWLNCVNNKGNLLFVMMVLIIFATITVHNGYVRNMFICK